VDTSGKKWGVRASGRDPVTKRGRIIGAVRDALLLGAVLVLGFDAGQGISHLVMSNMKHVTHYQFSALAMLLGYVVASAIVGAWLLNRWMWQRIVIPLGSLLAWLALFGLGSILGAVALPFVVLWVAGSLVWAILAPSPKPPVLGVVYMRNPDPEPVVIDPPVPVGWMPARTSADELQAKRSWVLPYQGLDDSPA